MAYTRPSVLTEDNGYHLLATLNGSGPLQTNVLLSASVKALVWTYDDGSTLAMPRVTEDRVHWFEASGRAPSPSVDETTPWINVIFTFDPEQHNSSQWSDFFMIGRPITPGGNEGAYVAPPYIMDVQHPVGAMEWFGYITPAPGSLPTPVPAPLIHCEPLDPDWPYADPYMTALSGPPGVVRRTR